MHRQDSWKKSAYAFVPYQTNFGDLTGFADDVVAGGHGFPMHPHANMEISTIVLQGAQRHRDDTGAEGLIDAHTVQTMSAGRGIRHSEFNASATEPVHSFQIWVYPKTANITPRHDQFSYEPADKQNAILLALSPDGRAGSAIINQDAFFSLSQLEPGKSLPYHMNLTGNGVYVHCASGQVQIEGYTLGPGDALGVYETTEFLISATQTADLIFVEVPMQRGIHI
jgi:hypothetical protein